MPNTLHIPATSSLRPAQAMQASRVLPLCLCLIAAPGARGGRRGALNASAIARAAFVCPDECRECCTAAWVKTSVGDVGSSGTHFKCLLKSSAEEVSLPGRECSAPVRRKTSNAVRKTECTFTEEEVAARAWDELGQCSIVSRCCCDLKSMWSESLCLGMDVGGDTMTALSPKSGKEELYRRAGQTYPNEAKPCQRPGSQAVAYQKAMKEPLIDTGCCLETVETRTSERYRCGTQMQHVGKVTVHRPRYCHRDVKWQKCISFELLYRCGDLEQTGQHFERVPETGMCIGDRSTAASMERVYGERGARAPQLRDGEWCPSGWVSNNCACNEACGQWR